VADRPDEGARLGVHLLNQKTVDFSPLTLALSPEENV